MNLLPYREWRPRLGARGWGGPAATRLGGGDGIPLLIGEECTVGHRVILHACTIGRRCLAGMGAIVMDGAVAGDEEILGRGGGVPGRHAPAPGPPRMPPPVHAGVEPRSAAQRMNAVSPRP